MQEDLRISNYIDLFRLIEEKNNDCDILIDFNSQKDWIKSRNITVTLIPHEESSVFFAYRNKDSRGYYVRDKNDNSIKYICNIYGRYEYLFKDTRSKYISSYLDCMGMCRDDFINLANRTSHALIDNGENKLYYNCPEVYSVSDDDRFYTIKKRENNVIELYDRETSKLRHVCNIGKRYEFFFQGEYKYELNSSFRTDNDIIIQIVSDDERPFIQVATMINPDNNPYIVRDRDDGGVDLISKKDNAIKYICNIGKSFYYMPHSRNRM
jgi:hypothetical protein